MDRLPLRLNEGQAVDIAARRVMPLLDSGVYRIKSFNPLEELVLTANTPYRFENDIPDLAFIFIQDEISRSLSFERGDAEVTYNALNIEKTDWVMKHTRGSQLISSEGFHLSFIGFNLALPELQDLEVRRHIAMAIPVEVWAHEKWKDWVVPLHQKNFPQYDLKAAQDFFKLHPLPTLKFLTTSIREGLETAQMIRETLKKVGVSVEITPVETTLFYTRIRSGDYSLFSSRFIRSSEKEPMQNYVRSNSEKNYFKYKNLELDSYLITHPSATFKDIEPWIEKDLPFFPLYQWRHCLILDKRVHFRNEKVPVLDETFRFLLDLELK